MSHELNFVDLWDFPVFKDTALNEKDFERKKQELGETEEIRNSNLKHLIEKLNGQKNFRPCLDESFLLAFLRLSQFNASKACDRILNFYRQMKHYSHVYRKYSDSAVSRTKWFRHCLASPCRMIDGSIILFNKHALMEPGEISFEEVYYLDCLICNQIMMYPAVQICGFTAVMDCSGFTFRKLLMHTPKRLQMYINTFQSTFPLRYTTLHLINVSPVFMLLYKLSCPLLSEKMKRRLKVHPSDEKFESLHSAIPPHLLPEEYCGELKDSSMFDVLQNAAEMSEEFKRHLQFGFVN